MMRVDLRVECRQFSRVAVEEEIRKASGAPVDSEPPTQAKYLGSYLSNAELHARSIVTEYPYVDRHFLEEYARYYATTLRPPEPKATRLHFFAQDLTGATFDELVQKAATGEYAAVCKELSESYLGFAVIRPLASAPVGRTILATYAHSDRRRHYALPPAPYHVHLAGLELQVAGVPFQQQEQGVGACATTAVWSTLARVMRSDGGRAPTPYAVTEAATRHHVSDRAFPAASGLDQQQILEAFRQFGYAPLYFEPAGQDSLFKLAVKCYVRSGIPVVLYFWPDARSAHAVAVVGFRDDDDDEPAAAIEHQHKETRRLRSRGISRLYVHDDRLGPYARAEWCTVAGLTGPALGLHFLPREPGYVRFEEPAEIGCAMVPLYPKLRLSAHDLIAFACQVEPLMSSVLTAPEDRQRLTVDLRFVLAGDHLRELLDQGGLPETQRFPPVRTAALATHANLSRYVGVIRFSVGEDLVADFVCDSTDIRRDVPVAAPLLAIVPRFEEHLTVFQDYAVSQNPSSPALVV